MAFYKNLVELLRLSEGNIISLLQKITVPCSLSNSLQHTEELLRALQLQWYSEELQEFQDAETQLMEYGPFYLAYRSHVLVQQHLHLQEINDHHQTNWITGLGNKHHFLKKNTAILIMMIPAFIHLFVPKVNIKYSWN